MCFSTFWDGSGTALHPYNAQLRAPVTTRRMQTLHHTCGAGKNDTAERGVSWVLGVAVI